MPPKSRNGASLAIFAVHNAALNIFVNTSRGKSAIKRISMQVLARTGRNLGGVITTPALDALVNNRNRVAL